MLRKTNQMLLSKLLFYFKKVFHFINFINFIFRVQCSECNYHWCFKCHAPWHEGLSCKQYRKGDRLLKSWAKEKIHGQLNAQQCPKCKV